VESGYQRKAGAFSGPRISFNCDLFVKKDLTRCAFFSLLPIRQAEERLHS